MKRYVYPAVFHPNEDGSFTIIYPDLPGCISEGKTLEDAMRMAQSALTQWMGYLVQEKQEIPRPSALGSIETRQNEFASLIYAEIKNDRAVKRTVSIPKWMDDGAIEVGLSLSRVLQEALKEKLSAG